MTSYSTSKESDNHKVDKLTRFFSRIVNFRLFQERILSVSNSFFFLRSKWNFKVIRFSFHFDESAFERVWVHLRCRGRILTGWVGDDFSCTKWTRARTFPILAMTRIDILFLFFFFFIWNSLEDTRELFLFIFHSWRSIRFLPIENLPNPIYIL